MLSKYVWKKYSIKAFLKLQILRIGVKFFNKTIDFTPKKIKNRFIGLENAQNFISQAILSKKPTLISRFGIYEGCCTSDSIGIRLGCKKKISKKLLYAMNNNAGVFPYGEEMALRFGKISEDAAKQVDLLGWWSTPMQDYLILEVCKKDLQICKISDLDPFFSKNPWMSALKGKKVLVIHPFKESIEKQYQKRELLFENPNILPQFDLTVIKAVQTIAGEKDSRFKDWEEALNYMYNSAMEHDFDVAIIGCGAYGMPLAAKIKEAGKVAIHLGGATQLLFGIKGARWDNSYGKVLYNEHWVRPLASEIPPSAKKVENGCYW